MIKAGLNILLEFNFYDNLLLKEGCLQTPSHSATWHLTIVTDNFFIRASILHFIIVLIIVYDLLNSYDYNKQIYSK